MPRHSKARPASPAAASVVGQNKTTDQIGETGQAAGPLDPEPTRKRDGILKSVDWGSSAKTLTPWGMMCVAWVLLNWLTDQAATATRAAILSNKLTVLVIVLALAGIILTVQVNDK